MKRPLFLPSVSVLVTIAIGGVARAQDARVPEVSGVDGRALVVATGPTHWLTAATNPTAATAGWGASAALGHHSGVLQFRPDADGLETRDLVGSVTALDLAGWWGGDRGRAGLTLPILLQSAGVQPERAGAGASTGDVALQGQVRLLGQGFATLGLGGMLVLPTGPADAALGAARPWVRSEVVGDLRGDRLAMVAGLGGRSGPGATGLDAGAALTWRVGASANAGDHLTLLAESQGARWGGLEDAPTPVEVLGGLALRTGGAWGVRLAGGGAVTRGVGAPAWRTVLSALWAPRPEPEAPVAVAAVAVPAEPEPVRPGRLSLTLRDDAGNAVDAQVLITGDGEPRRLRTKDGVLDLNLPAGSYAVQLRAEGRAPVDRAIVVRDGEPVLIDATLSQQRVRFEADRLVLSERIYFETGSAVIARRSFPLLDEVAKALIQHDEAQKVAIRGHTDDRGSDALNLTLSLDRARAVENYLVQSGVPFDRLQAFGLGEQEPLILGDSEEARAANRRVEFIITERRAGDTPNEATP